MNIHSYEIQEAIYSTVDAAMSFIDSIEDIKVTSPEPRKIDNIECSEDGVPLLIQSMQSYVEPLYNSYRFRVEIFTGQILRIDANLICSHKSAGKYGSGGRLDQSIISSVEKLILERWKDTIVL